MLLEAPHPNATPTAYTYGFNLACTKTLMVKHPKLGWVPPGGRVDGEEEPLAAGLRELREETSPVCVHVRHRAAMLPDSDGASLDLLGCVVYASESHGLAPETDATRFALDDLPVSVFPQDSARIPQAASAAGW